MSFNIKGMIRVPDKKFAEDKGWKKMSKEVVYIEKEEGMKIVEKIKKDNPETMKLLRMV